MDKAKDKNWKKYIQDWDGPEDIKISILDSNHPEQSVFTRFAEDWAGIRQIPAWEESRTPSKLPGFALKENITYSALPMERELSPFLKGLESLGSPGLSKEVRDMLDQLDHPCDLTLYIALQCPHCPAMVEMLLPLAAYSDKIRLHIIDGSLFPEQAQADRVMAAPCLILDQDFRWTGAVAAQEVISMALNRDPARLGTDTLKNILESGDADWITSRMIEAGKIFEGFLGLLLHPTWSVRLGAMVVVEALAERAPDLGLELVPLLMAPFDSQDIPTQGDMLYALGEIGNLETRAWIRKRMEGLNHEDLRDAAEDALEAIESRFNL